MTNYGAEIKAALRNVRIATAVVLVALTVALIAFLSFGGTYQSTSTFALTLTPTSPEQRTNDNVDNGNALLGFDTRLRSAASVLTQASNTPGAMAKVTAGTDNGTLSVSDVGPTPNLINSNAPFIFVTSQAGTPNDVLLIIDRARSQIQEDLDTLQNSSQQGAASVVKLAVVVPPSQPSLDISDTYQSAILSGVLAALITFAIVVMWRIRTANRRQKNEREGRNDATEVAEDTMRIRPGEFR